MIETEELKFREQLYDIIPFLNEVFTEMPDKGASAKKSFKTLEHNIGRHDFAVWLQRLNGLPIAFGSGSIVSTLSGEVFCDLWLIYARSGADLKKAFTHFVCPWAVHQGATKLRASNCTFTEGKDRWFERFGMEKVYDVYEKELLPCLRT